MNDSDTVRRPRFRIFANGSPVDGCLSAEIRSARGSVASTLRLEICASGPERAESTAWIDQNDVAITVDAAFLEQAGYTPLQWTRLFTGRPDRVTYDPIAGIILIDARDNAALLLDQPLQDAYLNRTSTEIVRDLGARCGLLVVADETSGLIGQYYQIQHSKTVFGAYSKHANGWDLLCELAQIQNFELWVDADTLYFQRLMPDQDPLEVKVATPQSGSALISALPFMSLQMERSAGLSGPAQVTVSSWNSRQKHVVVESYPEQATAGSRCFTIVKPNLLADEALALAEATYVQIRARQRILSGWMPGELSLAPRRGLVLTGTGTGWDARYIIEEITRHYSIDRGFSQNIVAVSAPELS